MKKEGHNKEEVYEYMGFPPDTNYEGDIVSKPDEVTQENRHRAKILWNDLQCYLRRRKDEIILTYTQTHRPIPNNQSLANILYFIFMI